MRKLRHGKGKGLLRVSELLAEEMGSEPRTVM